MSFVATTPMLFSGVRPAGHPGRLADSLGGFAWGDNILPHASCMVEACRRELDDKNRISSLKWLHFPG
jgi:hypothetical protein